MRGKRVHGFVLGRRFARINVVAGLRDGQILGEYCFTGTMNAVRFETWFCTHLLSNTRNGDVVVLDNARFHNKKRLEEYARIFEVTIIFLPPYSPDLNLIEITWANMKRFLRNYSGRFSSIQDGIYWYFEIEFS